LEVGEPQLIANIQNKITNLSSRKVFTFPPVGDLVLSVFRIIR
jgi:hypothetical protein